MNWPLPYHYSVLFSGVSLKVAFPIVCGLLECKHCEKREQVNSIHHDVPKCQNGACHVTDYQKILEKIFQKMGESPCLAAEELP